MRFCLSEQQIEMQTAVRRFLAEKCPPARVKQIFDAADGFDADVWRGLCEMGIAGLATPADYGGSGLELLDLALMAEALGEAATPGPFLGHILAGLAIAWGGTLAQRERWLPKLASGELLATIALAEAGGRWEPHEWTLAATGTIEGTKVFVPYASKAQLWVVGLQGGQLAVVESSDSLQLEPMEAADRTRRLEAVKFNKARAQILEEGSARVAQRLRDAALVLLAADAFGGAQQCVRKAVDYANTREQFGVAIGQFQGLKYQIVDTAIEVEPARGLYWYAAHAFDHIPAESERMAALAKAHLSELYVQAARRMIDVHGGIGYTWEFDAHVWLKRAMFDYAFMGSADAHRQRAAKLAGWTRE
jgi:alkylation response protein AidB-like acyl-CoA dehydrogenase